MVYADRLIDTPLIITEGMSDSDLESEWNAMIQRSILTQKLCDGLISWEYYLDFMAQQGYEPAELLDTAEENLKFCINQGIAVQR